MKKKIIMIMVVIIVLVVLLFPVHNVYRDGGTQTYSALAYKVIIWKELEGRRGTEVYIFPENLHTLDYYKK